MFIFIQLIIYISGKKVILNKAASVTEMKDLVHRQ